MATLKIFVFFFLPPSLLTCFLLPSFLLPWLFDSPFLAYLFLLPPSMLASLFPFSFLPSLLPPSFLVYPLLPPSPCPSLSHMELVRLLKSWLFCLYRSWKSFYITSSEIASVSFHLLLFFIASWSLTFLIHIFVLSLLDLFSQTCYWMCPLTNFNYFYFSNLFYLL